MKKCLSVVLAVLLLGMSLAVGAAAQEPLPSAYAQHGLYASPPVNVPPPSPMERFVEFGRRIDDWVRTLPTWLSTILDVLLTVVALIAAVLLFPIWFPIEFIWRMVR
ncbi:MAG: hypothetical protein FWB76_05560 [Oscillospiraceae bacterium]|nr:hypothetical protein [Oscillospiraceae bacterium]